MFIIGPDKKLKLTVNYPASVGRNMDEIVRVTDALMLSAGGRVTAVVGVGQGYSGGWVAVGGWVGER